MKKKMWKDLQASWRIVKAINKICYPFFWQIIDGFTRKKTHGNNSPSNHQTRFKYQYIGASIFLPLQKKN